MNHSGKDNSKLTSQQYLTAGGVPKLKKPEHIQVGLTPAFKRCQLFVTRNGNTDIYTISKMLAAELIAAGFSYEG